MRKLLLILAAAAVTGGCAYPVQSTSGFYPSPRPMYPRPAGPQIGLGGLPVARWDNVMMLQPGVSVQVLSITGTVTTASFVTATNSMLRVRSAAGDVDIAAETVMRVDRLFGGPPGREAAVRDGARGAAIGAGAVGVLGLLAGRMPPARVAAAGAIVGAYHGVEGGALTRTSEIVYLSTAANPRSQPGR